MNKANYALRLQPSLKAAAERLAAREGTSLDQFINIAVAEKLSALETATYFEERAKRADREAGMRYLDEALDNPPIPGDELPEGWPAREPRGKRRRAIAGGKSAR